MFSLALIKTLSPSWKSEISIRDANGRIIETRCKTTEVSRRDPLVQWYAEHTNIEWYTNPEGKKRGKVIVNETPLLQDYGWSDSGYISYFLTHDWKGVCATYAWVAAILFDIKGYPARTMRSEFEIARIIYIDGEPVNPKGHVWAEVIINDQIYVINFGLVMPQEEYYQKHNDWKIMVNRVNNWPSRTTS